MGPWLLFWLTLAAEVRVKEDGWSALRLPAGCAELLGQSPVRLPAPARRASHPQKLTSKSRCWQAQTPNGMASPTWHVRLRESRLSEGELWRSGCIGCLCCCRLRSCWIQAIQNSPSWVQCWRTRTLLQARQRRQVELRSYSAPLCKIA